MSATMSSKTFSDVIVIGGAVMDVVYQAKSSSAAAQHNSDPESLDNSDSHQSRQNPSRAADCVATTASMMYGTSTPCKLARMSAGGVGRNISEALARLGVDVTLRTVVGGERRDELQRPRPRLLSAQGTMEGDVNTAEEQALTADANGRILLTALASLSAKYPNLKVEAHVAVAEDEHDASDAAHLTPNTTGGATPPLLQAASTATYMALLDGRGELVAAAAVMDIFETSFTPRVALTALPPLGALPKTPLPKWVVFDGNVPKLTLDAVCRHVQKLNESLRESQFPLVRIAFDPISKEKALKTIDTLPLITLMKPNQYEAISLGLALASQRAVADAKDVGLGGGRVALTAGPTRKSIASILATNIRTVMSAWADNLRLCEGAADLHALITANITSSKTDSTDSRPILRLTDATFTNKPDVDNEREQNAFERIALLVRSLRRQLGSPSTSNSFSAVMALFWETFESFTVGEQEVLGLLASIFLVEVGGVGTVLCSIGKGGCWKVAKTFDSPIAHVVPVAARSHPNEIDGNESPSAQKALRCGKRTICVRHVPSIPIPPHRLAKVTGAGDSFLSGFIYGTLKAEKTGRLTPSDCERRGLGFQNVGDIADWPWPERCAALAAASALISTVETINPTIKAIVNKCDLNWLSDSFSKL